MKKKEENTGLGVEAEASASSTQKADSKVDSMITELTNDLQRTRADFENFRKQVELQKENEKKNTKLATVYKLLPFLDDLDRAFLTYKELEPLKKSFEKTLKELGLMRVESDKGVEFNPDIHEAVMVEGDGEKEVVEEVLRNGYYYESELLRPTMVSSIKINGKKLYEYAREGIEIERPLRDIEVYEMEALNSNSFRVSCSSGTYVRSLIRDLAIKSGNIGCMSSLVRSKVGNFTLDDCYELDDIDENVKLLSIYDALSYLPKIDVIDDFDVRNGKKIRIDTNEDTVLMVKDKTALAIYKRHHKNVFECVRGLW